MKKSENNGAPNASTTFPIHSDESETSIESSSSSSASTETESLMEFIARLRTLGLLHSPRPYVYEQSESSSSSDEDEAAIVKADVTNPPTVTSTNTTTDTPKCSENAKTELPSHPLNTNENDIDQAKK